jgi:drug/metabolite transporter (DMT)-like permease
MNTSQSRSYFILGFVFCFLGAIFFSTKAIIVKVAYRETDVDAVSLLALRMLFSLPFFIIAAYVSSARSTNIKFTISQWVIIATIGCLGYYISSLLDFIGLQYVSAGIERLILFIYPTLVLLMSSLIFKSEIKPFQWVAVGVTYVGLLLAFYAEAELPQQNNNGLVFGSIMIFICAITYAAYIVGSGRLIPVVGAAKFNSYAMSFACIGVLIHFFIKSDQSLLTFSNEIYGYSFAMAIISTVIPTYMISEGIRRIGSGNAAIVGSVGPVSTIIQAYYFLGEPFLLFQIIGTALVLVGVLIIGRGRKNKLSS